MESVGAVAERVHGPATAVADVARAVRRARVERRAGRADAAARRAGGGRSSSPSRVPCAELAPVRPAVGARPVADAAARAPSGPAIIARPRRGAGRRRDRRCGASASSSAPCWPPPRSPTACSPATRSRSASPAASPRRSAQRLLAEADVVIAFGAALNVLDDPPRRADRPDATVIQVDRDAEAIGAHRPVDLGVVGDAARDRRGAARGARRARRTTSAAATQRALAAEIAGRRVARRAVRGRRATGSTRARCSIALDEMLPAERTVVVDSGAFMGYPSMYLRVPGRAGLRLPAGVPVRRARRSATRSARRSRGRTA